jgi:NitT/TauT family transport system permease protein
MQKIAFQLLGAVLAIFLWWFSTDVINQDNPILGEMGPWSAVTAIFRAAEAGWLFSTVGASLFRLTLGLVIAVALGLLLGLLVGSFRRLEYAAGGVIQFIRMVSPLSWAPIAIMVFGIGDSPVVFLVAIAAIWPVLLATVSGMHALDARWWLLAKTLSATRFEFVRTFVLPGIRAQVTTGIRLALGVSWIVLVPAEMLGVDSGLGYQVLNTRDQFDYALLAGVMLVIGFVGYFMDLLAKKVLS